jgi:hypothetical protein
MTKRRPDFTLFLYLDRSAGYRDRSPAWCVAMQMPKSHRYPLECMTDFTESREQAKADLLAQQQAAGRLLLQEKREAYDRLIR